MKNLLIVISGPSGVGKGTVVDKLLSRGGYALSVSCTTRAPRDREKDGVSYFFISREKFLKMIESDGFLEYSNHFGNYYGTPREFVESKLKECDVLLEIDVDGALQIKRSHPEALLLMLLPPSAEELRARLIKRGSESEKSVAERLERYAYEYSKKDEYDYVVINDEIETAVAEIEKIIADNKGE